MHSNIACREKIGGCENAIKIKYFEIDQKTSGKIPYLSQLFWQIGLKLANNLYAETNDNLFNQAQFYWFGRRFIDVVLISWSNLTWSCISTRSLNSFSENVWHRIIACQVKLNICFAFLNWFHCLTWACLIEATSIKMFLVY